MHATDTRCKRRDGAWVVETNENPASEPMCAGGRGAAAAFLRPCSAGIVEHLARTLTPRGRRAPLYVEWQKRGTRKLRSAHLRRVELRDGRAVDGTKKESAQPRGVMMRAAHVNE